MDTKILYITLLTFLRFVVSSFKIVATEGDDVIIPCLVQSNQENDTDNINWQNDYPYKDTTQSLAYRVDGYDNCKPSVICNFFPNNGSLILPNVTKADSGVYYCYRGDSGVYPYNSEQRLEVHEVQDMTPVFSDEPDPVVTLYFQNRSTAVISYLMPKCSDYRNVAHLAVRCDPPPGALVSTDTSEIICTCTDSDQLRSVNHNIKVTDEDKTLINWRCALIVLTVAIVLLCVIMYVRSRTCQTDKYNLENVEMRNKKYQTDKDNLKGVRVEVRSRTCQTDKDNLENVETPADPPTMVKAEPTSSSMLRLTWEPVDESNFKGEITGYRIYYWPQGSTQEDGTIVETAGTGTKAVLEDLQPATTYYVVIEALSGGGEGPSSVQITAVTKKTAPLKSPSITKADVTSDNSIKLAWTAITTGNMEEPLAGYKILYWKQGTFIDTADNVKLGKDKTSYTLKSLEPLTTYYIKVMGYSDGGDGAHSEQQDLRTENLDDTFPNASCGGQQTEPSPEQPLLSDEQAMKKETNKTPTTGKTTPSSIKQSDATNTPDNDKRIYHPSDECGTPNASSHHQFNPQALQKKLSNLSADKDDMITDHDQSTDLQLEDCKQSTDLQSEDQTDCADESVTKSKLRQFTDPKVEDYSLSDPNRRVQGVSFSLAEPSFRVELLTAKNDSISRFGLDFTESKVSVSRNGKIQHHSPYDFTTYNNFVLHFQDDKVTLFAKEQNSNIEITSVEKVYEDLFCFLRFTSEKSNTLTIDKWYE